MYDFPELIAYVDDDDTMLEVVRGAVEGGTDRALLISYNDGQDFLDSFERARPELVLLDLKMPKLSGPDILSLMREHKEMKDIPVIFLTGVGEVKMTPEFEKMGVLGVLHKPIDIKGFVDALKELWELYTPPNFVDE